MKAAAERCAGYALVPLVRFANGAEHQEERQCVRCERKPEEGFRSHTLRSSRATLGAMAASELLNGKGS